MVIWGEKYEGGSDRITVGFDQTYDEVWVYNPTKGTAPEMVLNNVNSIELDISNHPYIIEIGEHPESSVEDMKNDDFQIRAFPNPVIRNLTIYSDTEIGKVSLFDLMGNCVYTGRVYDKVYTVSGLACINPNGTHAPGKVCPLSAFPINGLTKESTSSFPSDEEILLHAVTNKTPDNIHNKFLII